MKMLFHNNLHYQLTLPKRTISTSFAVPKCLSFVFYLLFLFCWFCWFYFMLFIIWLYCLLHFRQKPGFLSTRWGILTIILAYCRPFYRHVQLWRRRFLLSRVGLRRRYIVGLPNFEFLWRLLSKHMKKHCDEPRSLESVWTHAPPCRALSVRADFFFF